MSSPAGPGFPFPRREKAHDAAGCGDPPGSGLDEVLRRVCRVLPAQGPIGIFIHHNTLHAFEGLDFDDAVVRAGRMFGCEPFLAEDEYREQCRLGRISEGDLRWALAERLGADSVRPVLGGLSRLELGLRLVRYGIPEASGPSLDWLLRETPSLRRFREEVPGGLRQGDGEEAAVLALWEACLGAAGRVGPPARAGSAAVPVRHRDLILAAGGPDTDAWVHPVLIRGLGAFLDQGLSRWSLPSRSRGFHSCFLELYSHWTAALCGRWADGLPELLREERRLGLDGRASLERSLDTLGVAPPEWEEYLGATALALRGWGGMVRQLEARPDRVPARSVPASLTDFLAVRLLLERAALDYGTRQWGGFLGPLSDLRAGLKPALGSPEPPSVRERGWVLFHAAQLCGLAASEVAGLSGAGTAAFESEILAFDGIERRRILQSAYDRHLRNRVCDALVGRGPVLKKGPPAFQAVFCIDEREESFRRHLEEVAPDAETFGAAGFFGIAMYYQGATDAHPRPLCPIAIQPKHYVGEVKVDPDAAQARWRRLRRRGTGRLGRFLHLFSGTALGGSLIAAALGPLAILPLVLRVVFPGLARRWISVMPFSDAPPTRLLLDRQEAAPPMGERFGYTKEEMASIVGTLLRGIGAAGRLAPTVLVVGHGSTSLNNPHESAHDCGACGGGRGGPNARAFAMMANDPAVRGLLAREGLRIPEGTWFIGAHRNTCDNEVEFYDLDLMPQGREAQLKRIATAFAHARRREAHERCRRFETFPLDGGHGAALAHVEARARDLAQPRPEYGHATNAFCVVGRRERTAGLFLDRRAFLVSYDPTLDPDLSVLERTLAAVVPVLSGISLEYYFSRVDPSGYGCATKLPHNVACLLGVMDGAQSDLRTGLPWQMVEIHEPVRLFIVVECRPERFDEVLSRLPDFRRLLDGRWVFAACLDPGSRAVWTREGGAYRPWTAEAPLPSVTGDSLSWYGGRRDFLPIAAILSGTREGAA